MPGGAETFGAASDDTDEDGGASTGGVGAPVKENPEQLNNSMPGPSNENPQELTKTESASKATSPIIVVGEPELDNPNGNEGTDSLDNLLQGTKIEDIGPFATRLKFEETKSQFDQLSEVMKERAMMTMVECLAMQLQQQQQQYRRSLQVPSTQERKSLSSMPSTSVVRSMSSVPLSLKNLRSDTTLTCCSIASAKAKAPSKAAKMAKLEKQVDTLEKQCRIMDRHLREHDRDQKGMESKIHCLEMKILYEGQKQMIWNMMEKIPTDEDLKTIESFHSFALERKRTESQIKILKARVRALNTAMGAMSVDPLQIEKKTSLVEDEVMKSTQVSSRTLPDFTSMTPEEREDFFRKAGVTLYEYDRDSTEPAADFRQTKQKGKKFKLKKVNVLEEELESSASAKSITIGKRKTRGISDDEQPTTKSTKSKTGRFSKNSSSSDESPSISTTPSLQAVQSAKETDQPLDVDMQVSYNALRLAADSRKVIGAREKSPSVSEDSTDSDGSISKQGPAEKGNPD